MDGGQSVSDNDRALWVCPDCHDFYVFGGVDNGSTTNAVNQYRPRHGNLDIARTDAI